MPTPKLQRCCPIFTLVRSLFTTMWNKYLCIIWWKGLISAFVTWKFNNCRIFAEDYCSMYSYFHQIIENELVMYFLGPDSLFFSTAFYIYFCEFSSAVIAISLYVESNRSNSPNWFLFSKNVLAGPLHLYVNKSI